MFILVNTNLPHLLKEDFALTRNGARKLIGSNNEAIKLKILRRLSVKSLFTPLQAKESDLVSLMTRRARSTGKIPSLIVGALFASVIHSITLF